MGIDFYYYWSFDDKRRCDDDKAWFVGVCACEERSTEFRCDEVNLN